MTRRQVIAVGVAVLTMVLAIAQPLWIRTTGDEIALELQPVDPLSFFRGNYVDLTYDLDIDPPADVDRGATVFVVFDDSRPAQALRATGSQPDLAPGESCIRGSVSWSESIRFRHLEQFFVTAEEGGELEHDLSSMVGLIRTTGSCRSILVDIERK